MAWIKTVDPEEAAGSLKRIYDDSLKRSGKVFNVVSLQSSRPHVLKASLSLYSAIMISSRSGLSRIEREMIATVVSKTNGCFY